MMWALIFMSTARFSIPEYVEVYETRQECISRIPKDRFMGVPAAFCAPIEKKK